MSNRHLSTADEAWDAAEKVFADLGIEWALERSGDKFHMATPDGVLRVAAEEQEPHGWQFVAIHKANRLVIWRCSYPPVVALAELLTMLGYGTHVDGSECGPADPHTTDSTRPA